MVAAHFLNGYRSGCDSPVHSLHRVPQEHDITHVSKYPMFESGSIYMSHKRLNETNEVVVGDIKHEDSSTQRSAFMSRLLYNSNSNFTTCTLINLKSGMYSTAQ